MLHMLVGSWIPCLSSLAQVNGRFRMPRAILVNIIIQLRWRISNHRMLAGTNYPNATGNSAGHAQGVERES